MNRANAITLVGACAGLAAALLAVEGHLAYALGTLIVCGICDVFDGLVARTLTRTEEERTFGARLDSLVDATSFGIAPPLVLHAAGLTHPAELALLFVYLACAVWRLAYFDTLGLVDSGESKRYRGLPTTFCALGFPVAGLAGFHSGEALRIALDVTAPVLAVLMVAPIRFPKPRGVWYGVIPAGGVGVLIAYFALADRFPGGSALPFELPF
jgi:CDP-diacylglycerol--serine O-phosphatidyltransferase